MNKGLSNMNKKKLIAEFNKTILDMKGNISSENSKKIQYKQQNKQNRFNNFWTQIFFYFYLLNLRF